MIWIFLSILATVIMYVGLKYIGFLNTNPIHVVVFNYVSNFVLGLVFSLSTHDISRIPSSPWLLHAAILGVSIFIVFVLLTNSSRYVGVSITSLSHKISMVIPVIASTFLYGEILSPLNIFGLLLAVTGLYLTLKKPEGEQIPRKYLFLPLLIFIIPGLNDTFIKYVGHHYLTDDVILYITTTFAFALLAAITYSVISKQGLPAKKSVISGLLVGVPNFGVFFFLFKALEVNPESSVVFSINNIGTILLSVIAATLIFKEKLRALNWLGIGLSLLAVFLISYF